MSKNMGRRGFLKALPFIPKATVEEIKNSSEEEKQDIIRPPYTLPDTDFSACVQCDGKCVFACEEKTLYRLQDGSPHVVFSTKGCTFCKKCAESCEYDVLSLENPEKIHAFFTIEKNSCLAWHGTMCFSCKEPCLDNAIIFHGLFNPEINLNQCSGCGFCLNSCPVGAIKVYQLKNEDGKENIS